jgi:aryl-alcohol dehydrogenase-like predicted oxidoreductase
LEYRDYIKGDTQVSTIGLGAWQLGVDAGWTTLSEKEAIRLVHKALDLGVNFFDTAPVYGKGTSELRLGKAFVGKDRFKLVINSKFGRLADGRVDFDAKHITATVEGSLKRLGIDYLDSVIIHSPPFAFLDGRNQEHYAILDRLKEVGKIKAYGASIDSVNEIEMLLKTTNATIIHAFFNVFHQDALDAAERIVEKNATVVAKIPLDSGWLTGKYTKDSVFTGVRNRWSKAEIATRAQLVDRFRSLVGTDRNLAQTALAFCLGNRLIASVIPGCVSEQQLVSNIESASKPLSNEMIKQLHAFYKEEIKPLRLPW